MPPKKLSTAPLLNNDKVSAVAGVVDTIAGKPLSWWFFVLMITLIGGLGYGVYLLYNKVDTLQESQMSYVINDQRALIAAVKDGNDTREILIDALKQNATAMDRASRVLDRMEARQAKEQ